MRVFIANFGRANWAWPGCLSGSTIAVMDDERLHGFWHAGDREGYIRSAIQHLRLSSGATVTRQVASRWFNLNTMFAETAGDVWIHREKDDLWWTVSRNESGAEALVDDPKPRAGSGKAARVSLFQKPCETWSKENRKGQALRWAHLHPKAREFLFTEGTGQQLSSDNAQYAMALLDGAPLASWHQRPDWRAKEGTGNNKKYVGHVLTEQQRTMARMAMDVFGTAAASGAVSTIVKKDKQVLFDSQAQLESYLGDLFGEQEGRCMLTDIPMLLDGADDRRLRCSVDRLDSSGHYAPGNLQLVCQFANFWKRADTNEEFGRLLDLVRAASAPSALDT